MQPRARPGRGQRRTNRDHPDRGRSALPRIATGGAGRRQRSPEQRKQQLPLDANFGTATVTYVVGRTHRGRGIASWALAELIKLAGPADLHADTAADNAGSLRVPKSASFVTPGAAGAPPAPEGTGLISYT
ncbi:GNAT family N-acetyltransferase [Streptomyces sp. NPDC001076]